MKIFHLSDLHLGKKVNGFSMIEEQKYIIIKILNAIDQQKPNAVIIAGDVYDKSVPSTEAVELFDKMLLELAKRDVKVFVISGNHDSAQRLAFASKLIEKSGIYFCPAYDGNVVKQTMTDDFGEINIYMLPFVRPANVRAIFGDEEKIDSYTQAVKLAVDNMNVDDSQRNILVTHQFVTGAGRCDSEEISVGGTDNVEASVFDAFDYVALGHIHSPQSVERESLRYCGTPLKYSFSEAKHKKSITVVDFYEKGNLQISTIELVPRRDLVEITGTYEQLTAKSYYEKLSRDDYYHITLTDEQDVYDAITKLRVIYPNLMKLDYNNKRTRHNAEELTSAEKEKQPIEYFEELYKNQNGDQLNDEQREFLVSLIEKVWEEQ